MKDSIRIRRAAWWTGWALAIACSAASAQDDVFAKLEAMCPDAVREIEARESANKPPPTTTAPTRPALRDNLLLMARQDQEAREFLETTGFVFDKDGPQSRRMAAVDSANLARLKHIVTQEGFPTVAMVGRDGVDAAWLLSIHAAADPDFQEQVLLLTKGHVRRGEVRSDQVAMLTDDLLAGRGKPQRYGTNFEMRDGKLEPTALEDAAHVDELRKAVGLGSLADYACVLRAMYTPVP